MPPRDFAFWKKSLRGAIIGSKQQLEKVSVAKLSVGDISVAPASTARNLGVLFDPNLKFVDAKITKTCCTDYSRRLLPSAQYKKDQEILNVGYIQMFGSCTGKRALRLL